MDPPLVTRRRSRRGVHLGEQQAGLGVPAASWLSVHELRVHSQTVAGHVVQAVAVRRKPADRGRAACHRGA